MHARWLAAHSRPRAGAAAARYDRSVWAGARSWPLSRDGTVAATVTIGGFATRVTVWNPRRVASSARARDVARCRFGRPRPGFDQTARSLLINTDRPARSLPRDTSSTRARTAIVRHDFSLQSSASGPRSPAHSQRIAHRHDAIARRRRSRRLTGRTLRSWFTLRSSECLNIGNGAGSGTAGLYTAGYTAYIGNVPAPSNVSRSKKRFIAMRWHERTREPFGAGVAVAVNASGAAVGSRRTARPRRRLRCGAACLVWQGNGATVQLAPASPLSVAYAIDDRGRVTGMLEDADHRHYAFLYANGTLHRLDDLARAPGWRFECGYAFTPGGGIVGIGTYRGTATAFIVTGL